MGFDCINSGSLSFLTFNFILLYLSFTLVIFFIWCQYLIMQQSNETRANARISQWNKEISTDA